MCGIEKLEAGLEYNCDAHEVLAGKEHAIIDGCWRMPP